MSMSFTSLEKKNALTGQAKKSIGKVLQTDMAMEEDDQ